jgi:2'-5' RNA ligase
VGETCLPLEETHSGTIGGPMVHGETRPSLRPAGDNAALREQYESIWELFLAECIEQRMYSEEIPRWLALSGDLLSCMIRLEDQFSILEHIRRIQEALGQHREVMVHPEPFLHITVRMFGSSYPTCEGMCHLDHSEGVQLPISRLDQALREAVTDQPSFQLKLRGVNSWREAPFIQAFDDGAIGELRRRVAAALPELRDRRYEGGFIPHLTVAYYHPGVDLAEVAGEIALLRDACVGELMVEELELVRGRGEMPYPNLVTLGRYRLRG